MTTKKKTRKQLQTEAEKADLSSRLFDMLVGAADGYSLQGVEDDAGEVDYLITASVGLEQMAGWLRAARNYLRFERNADWPESRTDEDIKEQAFGLDNLRHFDTLNTATEHLYDYGFRA